MEQILNTVLLYSLALGLVLALLTGLTLLLTRSASPLLRYRILVALLGLFTAGILTTGFLKLRDIDPTIDHINVQTIAQRKGIQIQDTKSTDSNLARTATKELISITRDFMNNNARIIALIWVFIVLAKGIKLTSNLFELHYLKTRQTYPAGKHWEDQVERLSRQMGLYKAVRIMQSALIQVPLVIGHFKPVILIPLGMITAIKPREIEMMLLHELAHIKRLDFLVNILQHVLELLFFFNPAVLWTSSLIRKERENCCDEMVLQNADEKHSYIQALLSFREYQLNVPEYAMAFAKESNLVSRVKRMVYQKNTALNSIEKGCMLIVVLLLCSFTILHSTELKPEANTYQEPVVKKEKSQTKPAIKVLKPASQKEKTERPAPKATSSAINAKRKVFVDEETSQDSSVNINTNINMSGNVSVNMAPDSSLQYSSTVIKAGPQPKASVQPRLSMIAGPNQRIILNPQTTLNSNDKLSLASNVEIKENGLTEGLIKALGKSGIDTRGENFTFHITNKELIVNGKKQPESTLNAVLKDFIKSPEDTIIFSYTREGSGVITSSDYHRK